ncbi:DUF3168 domain-containing protein [Paenisporosarcina cavernae]|uniref:DUF3168 domain-containing protein n=1 Tax=Paenisporosarcina cavernae TaxID=2320858 RepID=A0A385YQB6_9BACL|nr:DUF3168 domain-containing protein [Paenisporosarcina cavernae]AYC28724.1 DUF3168 domain-containing protein [Paenisporosarcina cavernae]
MIQTAMAELQKGIYERLSTDTALAKKVTGVFDYIGEDQLHPYVTVNEPISLPYNTKQSFGEELSIVINSWSTYAGKKESYDILNHCLSALSKKIEMTGFVIKKVDVDTIQVIDDADSRIKHGILRMKYVIQNN